MNRTSITSKPWQVPKIKKDAWLILTRPITGMSRGGKYHIPKPVTLQSGGIRVASVSPASNTAIICEAPTHLDWCLSQRIEVSLDDLVKNISV